MDIALTSCGEKIKWGLYSNEKFKRIFWYKIKKLWKKNCTFFEHNSTYSSCTHFLLLNFDFWSIYFNKHFWKPRFWNLLRPCTLFVLQTSQKTLWILYRISKTFLNFGSAISAMTPPHLNAQVRSPRHKLSYKF